MMRACAVQSACWPAARCNCKKCMSVLVAGAARRSSSPPRLALSVSRCARPRLSHPCHRHRLRHRLRHPHTRSALHSIAGSLLGVRPRVQHLRVIRHAAARHCAGRCRTITSSRVHAPTCFPAGPCRAGGGPTWGGLELGVRGLCVAGCAGHAERATHMHAAHAGTCSTCRGQAADVLAQQSKQ